MNLVDVKRDQSRKITQLRKEAEMLGYQLETLHCEYADLQKECAQLKQENARLAKKIAGSVMINAAQFL